MSAPIVIRLSRSSTRVVVAGVTATLAAGPTRPLPVAHAIGLAMQQRELGEDADDFEVERRTSGQHAPRRNPPHSPVHCPPSSAQRRNMWGDDIDDDRILSQIDRGARS